MQMTVTYKKNIIFLIFKFYNMKIIKFASSQNNKNTKTNNYSLNLWYKIKIYVPKSRIITADVDVSSSKQNLPNKKVKTVYFKIWTCANASEFRGHLCNFLYVLPKTCDLIKFCENTVFWKAHSEVSFRVPMIFVRKTFI